MSKMDGLRAMREAKYEKARSGAGTPTAARRPAQAADARPAESPRPPVAPEEPKADEGLCGHRSMNGRTCTREHGHSAKSHRYS